MYFLSVYVSRELCCLTAAVKVADTGNNGVWQQHAVYVLRCLCVDHAFARRAVRRQCMSTLITLRDHLDGVLGGSRGLRKVIPMQYTIFKFTAKR